MPSTSTAFGNGWLRPISIPGLAPAIVMAGAREISSPGCPPPGRPRASIPETLFVVDAVPSSARTKSPLEGTGFSTLSGCSVTRMRTVCPVETAKTPDCHAEYPL